MTMIDDDDDYRLFMLQCRHSHEACW